MSSKHKARVLAGSSETSADLLYATRFFVPDEILWVSWKGKTHAWFSPLEIDRARKSARIHHIHPLEDAEKILRQTLRRRPSLEEVAAFVLLKMKIRAIEVPQNFPIGFADFLRKKKIRVDVCKGEFFPQRQIKTPEEIRFIQRAQRAAEAGLERGLEILRAAKIDKKKFLKWNRVRLTSEILRGEIDSAIIRQGSLPAKTIVAGGRQACDPHETGHGLLRANQAIILDIFPRDQQTGYFADMTRTVVKGRASDALHKLYATVREGQKIALQKIKPGARGETIQNDVQSFFKNRGYPTEIRKGSWVGFFHGLGHSLGLEIHESPRFSQVKFRAGHIMTVEPGLYDPEIGGVRLEDLVVVQNKGVKNLTRAKFEFEIR